MTKKLLLATVATVALGASLLVGVPKADAHVGISIGIPFPGVAVYAPPVYYSAPAYYPPTYYYGPSYYRPYYGGYGYYGGGYGGYGYYSHGYYRSGGHHHHRGCRH
jgi:hypothetical protein